MPSASTVEIDKIDDTILIHKLKKIVRKYIVKCILYFITP